MHDAAFICSIVPSLPYPLTVTYFTISLFKLVVRSVFSGAFVLLFLVSATDDTLTRFACIMNSFECNDYNDMLIPMFLPLL